MPWPTSPAWSSAGRSCGGVCEQPPKLLSPVKIDDFLLWAALGVILGGRLGYVLFYKPRLLRSPNPLGDPDLVGRRHVVPWRAAGRHRRHPGLRAAQQGRPFLLSDLVAIVTPIGLFFGRLANFINGELWGRADRRAVGHDLPARRTAAAPSQPALPGVLRRRRWCSPWSVVGVDASTDGRRRPGLLTGVFCVGLRRGAHRGRAVPRARRPSRLSCWGPAHHGHAAVAARAAVRRLADRPRLSHAAAARARRDHASSAG